MHREQVRGRQFVGMCQVLALTGGAALFGAAAMSGCGHGSRSAVTHSNAAVSGPATLGHAAGSGSTYAAAVKALCGASLGDGLHGDAHFFQRESAVQAIVASFTAKSLRALDPGVTLAELRQALLAGEANIYREDPNGTLAYVDGSPVPGPIRISPTTVLPTNSEVDFFFTCRARDVITH
jgi:hypothetical protein